MPKSDARGLYTEGNMRHEYVEQRDGGFYIFGTGVSLDSVIVAFLRGESAEGIVESFPSLRLEQVFGALAYYLAHREAVERYLNEGRREFEELRQRARAERPAFYAKLLEARQKLQTPTT
jgi:uncharacterized protein (DUF433 family)